MRKVLATGLLVLVVSVAFGPLGSTGNAETSQVVGPNGHLYQRFDDTTTWHDAKDACDNLGGHLATITSAEEHDFVYDSLVFDAPDDMVWLGATDEVAEGTWAWVTNEAWDYTHWAGGEPNNCSGIEHYLVYFTPYDPLGRAGWWNDLGEGNDGGCGCGGCTYEWYPMSRICEWDQIAVSIDIKPGSYPNSINLGSRGVVPVAILTADAFDASIVDPATVVFAGAAPLRWAMEDVDYDGDLDLLFHFKTQELDLDMDSTEATLTGETFDGMLIEGTDTVNIVP